MNTIQGVNRVARAGRICPGGRLIATFTDNGGSVQITTLVPHHLSSQNIVVSWSAVAGYNTTHVILALDSLNLLSDQAFTSASAGGLWRLG